jgi:hypothetical protein
MKPSMKRLLIYARYFILLGGIQVAQYEDKFIDFFRRTMAQLKTVNNKMKNFNKQKIPFLQ